jgi:dTDP-4-dehydrorhamnose 3,5-epimerase
MGNPLKMISGVVVRELVTHTDKRGFFREIFRFSEEFEKNSVGQLSHSLVEEGVVKAWHGHKEQSQWNYVVLGRLKVVLYDDRPKSLTYKETMEFFVGEDEKLKAYYFPPGVLHGYKCLKGPLHIIYVTSGVYDLSDEIRIEPDGFRIRYSWSAGAAK